MQNICYSFDILDTCLCRSCGEPYAVFDLLAREVLGDNLSTSQLADFRHIRVKGEKIARQKNVAEDVTIEQIYKECDFSGLTDSTNDNIIKQEIIIERKVLRPIYSTLQKVKKIHSSEQPVLFISDMYLPSTFFVEVLEEFGFWNEGDKIFVSCEIGKSKVTGNLFRYVSNQLNINSGRWIHHGDNKHCDINVPRKLGICARHIKFNYSHYQKYLIGKDYDPTECYMARLAGISRAISISKKYSPRLQFAADIIAPINVSFTYNVLKDAKKRGIRRLFFIARDAHILYCIAKEMTSLFPDIEIKYLYASRKALYLPCLDEVSTDSLRTILPPYQLQYNDEYFDNFQINTNGLTYDEFQNDNIPPGLIEEIKKRWKEQKVNTLNYFIQEGLADNYNKVGIIDIRGSRRSQRCINKILKKNGYKEVFGYYMESDMYRITPEGPEEYIASIYSDYHASPNFGNISLNKILLEKYFCISSAKRTTGYIKRDDEIIPEFENGEYLPELFDSIHKLHVSVCLEFLRLFFNNKLDVHSNEIFNYSFSLISEFANHPQREYVKVLKDLEFNETSRHSQKIVGKINPLLYHRRFMWFRGSLLITSPLLLMLFDNLKVIYKKLFSCKSTIIYFMFKMRL